MRLKVALSLAESCLEFGRKTRRVWLKLVLKGVGCMLRSGSFEWRKEKILVER